MSQNHFHTESKETCMKKEFPILEFDPDINALINPYKEIKSIDIPERCVICFFQDVINKLNQQKKLTRVAVQKSEVGKHPVYVFAFKNDKLALFHPGVGAPLSAGLLEEVIARGCKKFIVCGSAGVLDSTIARGHLLVPISAVRDEGTSYHYLPPGREVAANPEAIQAIETVLKKSGIDYLFTKSWTTDAFYRETSNKIALRKSEGCLTVEMEAAALFAVAQFRNVILGQFLYGGDDVGGKEWNSRKWTKDKEIREKFFWLAAEACLEL
jgi:uridine phosphorylase